VLKTNYSEKYSDLERIQQMGQEDITDENCMIQTSWGSEVKITIARQIAHVGQTRNTYRILVC
jgi:hypothetical protein